MEPKSDATFRLTRLEVASRLGISVSSVRRLENVHLHPVLDGRGVWRFDESEVDKVPKRSQQPSKRARRKPSPRTDDAAARVFRLLATGADLREIVISTRQAPEVVRQLYSEWLTTLEQGERDRKARDRERHEREARERVRRDQADADRAHLELMKTLG